MQKGKTHIFTVTVTSAVNLLIPPTEISKAKFMKILKNLNAIAESSQEDDVDPMLKVVNRDETDSTIFISYTFTTSGADVSLNHSECKPGYFYPPAASRHKV